MPVVARVKGRYLMVPMNLPIGRRPNEKSPPAARSDGIFSNYQQSRNACVHATRHLRHFAACHVAGVGQTKIGADERRFKGILPGFACHSQTLQYPPCFAGVRVAEVNHIFTSVTKLISRRNT